jgi:hypothetical protein
MAARARKKGQLNQSRTVGQFRGAELDSTVEASHSGMQEEAMRRNARSRHVSLLLVLVLCLTALQAGASPKTLPDMVIHAHSVFLENETGFVEMEYTAILELTKWGRFGIAASREKADLVMRLDSATHVHVVPEGQYPGANAFADSDIPKGHTRIALLDPKTNALLWSDTHKTEGGKLKTGHLLDGLREAFDSYEKSRR